MHFSSLYWRSCPEIRPITERAGANGDRIFYMKLNLYGHDINVFRIFASELRNAVGTVAMGLLVLGEYQISRKTLSRRLCIRLLFCSANDRAPNNHSVDGRLLWWYKQSISWASASFIS